MSVKGRKRPFHRFPCPRLVPKADGCSPSKVRGFTCPKLECRAVSSNANDYLRYTTANMNDGNFQLQFAKLNTRLFASYLRKQGWTERVGGSSDRLYFEGEIHSGGKPYELMLPASETTAKYRTLMQRAVYKLCGIEDCEPFEVLQAIFEHGGQQGEATEPEKKYISAGHRLKFRNSGAGTLQVNVPSRDRDLQLFPGESVELVFDLRATETLEIEHREGSIIVHEGETS